jgi:hypothetical protein
MSQHTRANCVRVYYYKRVLIKEHIKEYIIIAKYEICLNNYELISPTESKAAITVDQGIG